MSLGIGLGAFAGGFKQGYGMGKQIKSDFSERKQKNQIQGIYDNTRKEFDEGVKAGQFDTNSWDKYSNERIYPQIISVYEKAGDYETAGALREHFRTQQGIEHGRTFVNGLFQQNIGNYHGMAEAANQILKNNGLKDINVTALEGGRMRISMPGANGKTTFQDMSGEEFGKIYNDKLNPEAAALYQLAQRGRNTAKAPGIAGGLSLGGGQQGWESLSDKDRWGMYKDVEKSLGEGDPDFYSRSADEQHKLIMGRIGLFFNATGLTGVNGQPMVLYDKNTGKPVASPAPTQGGQAGGDSARAPGIVRQDLPPTHQAERGADLPEPQPDKKQIQTGRYAGVQKRPAPNLVQQERHMPPGMREVKGTIPDDDPTYIPPKERPIPANKPPSREQLFQKWQQRKPANDKKQAAKQDEQAILQMMGERASPEKILKAVAAKFPYNKRGLVSPEFKELVDTYIKGFTIHPAMGWVTEEHARGLGVPFPKQKPQP